MLYVQLAKTSLLLFNLFHIELRVAKFTQNFLPFVRQHPSYGHCLEVKKEYYQNGSVLDCVTQCSQSTAHLYEQFLQDKQTGFVTLGPLRCAYRGRLPRVVLL